MMKFLYKRRILKNAREVLHHAKHLRNLREDILSEDDLNILGKSENKLRDAVIVRDFSLVEEATEALYELVEKFSPSHRFPGITENLEVLIVAIVVAMAVRTYFLQPFKIPTGSMSPTLNGIHSKFMLAPSRMDKMPFKVLKWVVRGDWYKEVVVKTGGHLSSPFRGADDSNPADVFFRIADKVYKLPGDAVAKGELSFAPGEYVPEGSVLWSGLVITGDHVFVNRMKWNFMKPQRGEIMVFSTTGITGPTPGASPKADTFYIKRMVGLPNEELVISNPNIYIDGIPTTEPVGIKRVTDGPGYRYADGQMYNSIVLKDEQYFALGDNTLSSKDSRYWGTVPKKNLVGPAFMVYWPFAEHWGFIE